MAKALTSTKKHRVLAKTNGRCAYCGDVLNGNNFTVDHIIPRHHGGENGLDNLFACCRGCNTAKGAKTIEQWRRFAAVKQVTGKAVFGQAQVDYLFKLGLFPALGVNDNYQFYFQKIGGSNASF